MTISFTKVALPYGWLGNMAPYPVTHEGVAYRTTEALFQALRYAGHPDIQELIRAEKSPMGAKFCAKRYVDRIPEYPMLGELDLDNMRLCLRLKLEQHAELCPMLLDTGEQEIIEDCTSRQRGTGLFWGAVHIDGVWVGKNTLGVLWMEQRERLKAQAKLLTF